MLASLFKKLKLCSASDPTLWDHRIIKYSNTVYVKKNHTVQTETANNASSIVLKYDSDRRSAYTIHRIMCSLIAAVAVTMTRGDDFKTSMNSLWITKDVCLLLKTKIWTTFQLSSIVIFRFELQWPQSSILYVFQHKKKKKTVQRCWQSLFNVYYRQA